MGIQVRWDDPDQTILLYELEGTWGWQEYSEAADQEWDMLDKAPYRVDTIIDLSRMDSLPHDAERHIRNAGAHVHLQRGLLVVAGPPVLTEAFGGILASIYPRSTGDILLVATVEQARSVIALQYGFATVPVRHPQPAAAPAKDLLLRYG